MTEEVSIQHCDVCDGFHDGTCTVTSSLTNESKWSFGLPWSAMMATATAATDLMANLRLSIDIAKSWRKSEGKGDEKDGEEGTS